MNLKDYINENDEDLSILGIKELKDGLSLSDIQSNSKFHWIIMAGIKNAVIGKKGNKLIWYDGEWIFGEYNENYAVWKKGKWHGGLDSKGKLHKNGDTPNKW